MKGAVGRKGGVLTLPQSDSQLSGRLAPRAVRQPTDCAGRKRGGIVRGAGNGGVKTPPLPIRGEKFRLAVRPSVQAIIRGSGAG
jgi:hypothetical protein